MSMKQDDKIYVAGHRGLVGSAIVRALKQSGFSNLLVATSRELDLRDQVQVVEFFEINRPDYVFLAAAKVGGILANSSQPAEFIRDNLLIQTNVIDMAYRAGSKKLLFLGSSCIYPKMAQQPIVEESLLSGPLEPTNEWYAIAKIAGLKMCAAYRRQYGFDAISCMPTNLYGPNDNFSLNSSHVVPALIRRFHEATVAGDQQVSVWGDGSPLREFMHVDDLASACVHLMQVYSGDEPINVGTGEEVSIGQLAELVSRVVGFKGEIVFDTIKPNGTPRKLLNVARLRATGWEPSVSLEQGLTDTYAWFVRQLKSESALREN